MTKPISPEEFAKDMGWAPKRVRRLAKKLGACRILGNRMALMPEDVETLLKATKPCPSSSLSDAPSMEETFGTIAGQLPAIDYEGRLAQRTARTRRELQPRLRSDSTKVVTLRKKER